MEDYLGMSDEDFLKMSAPEVEGSPVETPTTTEQPTEVPEQLPEEQPVVEQEVKTEEPEEVEPTNQLEQGTVPTEEPTPVVANEEPVVQEQPTQTESKQEGTEVDYKAMYEKLMAPLKANGKNIEIRSPDELIQLAQMGANYTRKMQEIAPQRKLLRMLENNNLLDEGQLSFFIDLKNKNPEAIKKLLMDSGIDPMELDTSVEPAYQQGNHRVSDTEDNFHSTLSDVRSRDGGQDTLQVIQTTWDQASKEMLWENPDVMEVVRQQRESGVYDLITAEIERLRAFGKISATTPFLHAYKQVGELMVSEGSFNHLNQPNTPVAQPAPVATKVAAPKSPVANSTKAAAASPTRAPAKTASVAVNPLAMKDDEFLKFMNDRL